MMKRERGKKLRRGYEPLKFSGGGGVGGGRNVQEQHQNWVQGATKQVEVPNPTGYSKSRKVLICLRCWGKGKEEGPFGGGEGLRRVVMGNRAVCEKEESHGMGSGIGKTKSRELYL